MENKNMVGHRERLRERYLKGGYDAFQDYEVVEMLLTICIPRKDVKSIAKELINKYKRIENIFKAEKTELSKIKGISDVSITNLKFIGDLVRYNFRENYISEEVTSFSGKQDLIAYLRSDIGFGTKEEFKVIFLNSANHLIEAETLFSGTIDKSAIYPREIVKKALQHNARSLIFAHNHPSGNLKPSKKDIEVTRELEALLKVVDVKVLDHIIITRDSHLSFLEEGLIDYY